MSRSARHYKKLPGGQPWMAPVEEESLYSRPFFRFFVLINICYSAFQKGKEKRKKKKREVEETAANCVKF